MNCKKLSSQESFWDANYFWEINQPLKQLLELFLQTGIFPVQLMISRVSIGGTTKNASGYRIKVVFPYFSINLRHII